jgi:diguanylate cyclase (GGDEF)-like protein
LRDITDRVSAEETVKEELVRLAHTDSLTTLANRRAFFEKLEEEFKRINRTNSEFSILLIDIDHFKKVNDSYGHDIGDALLKEVSKIIRSCLRETDLPARIGGEEFGIFLPDTPAKGAYFVAERICMRIAKHVFQFENLPPIGCTVSIGLAASGMVSDRDTTKLYKLADTRLYIAKHTGRNQVSADEIVQMH